MIAKSNKFGADSPARVTGSRGFTLVELLVVVAIIGILVSLSVPYLMDAKQRARETQTAANVTEVHNAIEAFGTDHNGMYPFRIRWFDDATRNAPGFDPYIATDTGTGLTSDAPSWCSLGLIGGVRTVTDSFADNTQWNVVERRGGPQEHGVIQPYGWQYDPFYRTFNQYSDPLIALGYLDNYPPNPFLKGRPMGNIAWNYGQAGSQLDHTIPNPSVFPSPGDFCYTFFYGTDESGTALVDPPGVVEAKLSYQAKSPTTTYSGIYYLDLVDSYQLWAYGVLPMNGPTYVIYPNNVFGLSVPGRREASKDWDNSGTKDMFEMGLIAYFKTTGSGSRQAVDAQGNRVEF